jgi:L,D-transpeptidase catalytic domain
MVQHASWIFPREELPSASSMFPRDDTKGGAKEPTDSAQQLVQLSSVLARAFFCALGGLTLLWTVSCQRGDATTKVEPKPKLDVTWRPASAAPSSEAKLIGGPDDNLPFQPDGLQILSTAMRTWVYTDTSARRTRFGYLRAGQIVDARGPAIVNEGCKGGWYRINPRGFVCLGLGATLDVNHRIRTLASRRPVRGKGFPYSYAMSGKKPPHRYFRLPRAREMSDVEGTSALAEGRVWAAEAEESGLLLRVGLSPEVPSHLLDALVKPYGAEVGLRTTVHSGRASSDSAFAILEVYLHEGRAFGLTTDFDLIPLDKTKIVRPSAFRGVRLEGANELRVGFHIKGALSAWRRDESGAFRPAEEIREKRAFAFTESKMVDGMVETLGGLWVSRDALRIPAPRTSFPSFAVGDRKWIDVAIRDQILVAYEGTRPVFATLVSTGRGLLGDPDRDQATVRGTFMIFDKSISSTMDGEEDRSDSFDLRDVPFVQYFHKGFALHGAYWHDEFGKARSHGCVNLAPEDAAFLFEWTDPQVPAMWHSVINKERGTVVQVRP